MKVRGQCQWYEYGGKSSKFFLKLEKSCAIQDHIRTVIYNDKETNNEIEINNHIYFIFFRLFVQRNSFSDANLITYLNTISFPKLTTEKK